MIRALTKRKKKGQSLYRRPRAVEAEVRVAVSESLLTLRQRLLVTRKDARGYLRTETLVHLLRNAFRSADVDCRDAVLPVLLGRCEAILKYMISERLPNSEKIREQTLSDFGELLAADAVDTQSEELDYYECQFLQAFRTLRITAVRSELAAINRATALPEDDDPIETDGNVEYANDHCSPITEAFHTQSTSDNAAFREQLLDAIYELPPEERNAVVLVHGLGFDEESDDPKKETAATLCNCTGRTIRNRLNRAAEKLSKFKPTEEEA